MYSPYIMLTRPLLLLALTLAACQTEPSSPGAPGTPASGGSSEALPDTATVQSVDPESSADLVSGDLTAASPSVAIQTIDRWVTRLDTVSADGASEVRGDLLTLRNLLQSSPLDGRAIGRTLRRLGDGTADLAGADPALQRLALTLSQQADQLAPDTTGTASGSPPEPPAEVGGGEEETE